MPGAVSIWTAALTMQLALLPAAARAEILILDASEGSDWSEGVDGDCRYFSFSEKFGFPSLSDEHGQPVLVLRHDAPVFDDEAGDRVLRRVAFSTGLRVVEIPTDQELPDERVRVSFPYEEGTPTAWMNRTDLLCNSVPMTDQETRLERKALIRTKTAEREDGVIQAITAFRTPDLKADDSIEERKLSRFTTYLIYAEAENAFLLGEKFNISSADDRLVGWVGKQDVMNWNWAIGLRPPADIVNPDGSIGTICGFESPTDRETCVPVLGGDSWFRNDLRLPVLEVTDDYYRVAAAASGLGGAEIVDGKLRLTPEMLSRLQINPGETGGVSEEAITSFNKIDVFFLIDGTRSMGPFIDAIRGDANNPGVVRSIVDAIERRGSGAAIRAGFRVFRDSVRGGQSGINEGYALRDTDCESDTPEAREQNRQRFERRLETIRTTTDDADDYDENLLGGLEQAAIDMYGCPDRQKLLFVVSDAGYDPDMQVSRGHEATTTQRVAQRLLELDKLTVFFIRPPLRDRSEFAGARSFELYEASWNRFREYGLDVLQRTLARDMERGEATLRPSDYFLNLASGASATESLLENIADSVKAVARPDVVNDILIDLRGGAALEQVITRLQRENQDVPVLYWNMLRRTACEDEAACSERIYDGVFDLYVPRSEPHVLEAWMRADQLYDWRILLRPIIDATGLSLPEQRDAMGQAIRNSLQMVLQLPSPDDLHEEIAEYMRRNGMLPGPIKTPLLGYTFEQLRNSSALPVCEVDRLRTWLSASSRMLSNAERQQLSDYIVEEPRECPGLTAQGRMLRYIREDPRPVPPGPDPDLYLLGRNYLNEYIYWVPHEYLP